LAKLAIILGNTSILTLYFVLAVSQNRKHKYKSICGFEKPQAP
jgi:hypothetical protein